MSTPKKPKDLPIAYVPSGTIGNPYTATTPMASQGSPLVGFTTSAIRPSVPGAKVVQQHRVAGTLIEIK